MTEQEWLKCADPRPMLDFLQDKASDRQLRLLACAYTRVLRGYWHLGPGAAVAVADRYADVTSTRLGASFVVTSL
jgi:hypothetical protein